MRQVVPSGELPSGTVTFLFTDVEGSTRLWMVEQQGMAASLAVHDSIVRAAIESLGGYVFSTAGDSFAAAFDRASDAVAAASNAQVQLDAASWPGPRLRVRIGLHLGEAEERDGDYFGATVSTAARVAAAGHGGQVLMTDPVRATSRAVALDLGVHHLRDVDEPVRLFQLGDDRFPPLRVVDPAMTNLPVRPTRLIGRDDDVARVRMLLADHRLVTVTAVGGSGKTRVAIAVGEAELPHRSGGVWFTDLAAVTTDTEVPAAISTAVGLSFRDGDPTAQLLEHLADKPALVILDNCEHVIDGCANFANRFLTTAGDAVLLATSREALAVDGECTMVLAPLAAEGMDAPAVRLFAERAAAADDRFVIDDTNAETVAAVCRRLDGIPLAIELAAARITMMTLPELEAGLDDRFALLGGSRSRPRQRTLVETLDWSFALLRDDEQLVLRALGTFFDGFDIDAVAGVAETTRGVAFAAVEALTSKSLVVRVEGGRRARFGLLETVKAYAEDRLAAAGRTVEARDRHLDHFHTLATAHGHTGVSELRLGVALRAERRNLTAAFEWAVATGRWERAGELITGGYPAYIFDGAALEARDLIKRALARPAVHDTRLDDELRLALVMTSAWLTDWATYGAAGDELTRSATASMRVFGFACLGVSTPFADAETSHFHLDRAQSELAAAEATAPAVLHDLLVAVIHWVEGRVAAGHGDYRAGLEGSAAFLAKCGAIDYYPTPTPRAAKHAAACQILLGDPAAAIDTVAWLESFDPSTFMTDDIRALALLAQDRVSDATPLVHAHAKRGLAGGMPGQVCDSVLLLAALAHAEGDVGRARDLLRHMGAGLEPGLIIFSRHLADVCGIGPEHAEGQQRALTCGDTDREGFNGTRMASSAVRTEFARRGWS